MCTTVSEPASFRAQNYLHYFIVTFAFDKVSEVRGCLPGLTTFNNSMKFSKFSIET